MKTLARCTSIALIFFVFGLGLWYVALPRSRMTVQELIVVDGDGNPRIVLSSRHGLAAIELFDEKGLHCVHILQMPPQLNEYGSAGFIHVYKNGTVVSRGQLPMRADEFQLNRE